ncbi:hypothetical protein BC938DRAFT_484164 [Jimgerdemannia flammicorona]|uniref:Kinesin light chain n=1 Tax=Jimgerdemannia flammicorona TaxID=994334 RepID=A0A433QAE3_9FUNG|nr:hypothetical protein BC938DRAFT_484164 [Jimgerdemannia flammicorona]
MENSNNDAFKDIERPTLWIINNSRRSQLLKAIDSQKLAQRQQNDMQNSTKRQRGLLTNETSLENLTQVYNIQGKHDEAEPLYQLLESEHPATATTLDNLTAPYKVLGPEHSDTATTLNNLVELHNSQKHYNEAEPLYQRGLAICQQMLRQEHSDMASLNNLAARTYQRGHKAVSLEGKCYPRGINGSERAHGDVVELNDVPVHIENESDNIEVGNDVNVRKLLENWYGAFGERETLLGLLLDPDGKYYDEHSRSSKSPIDLEIDATKHISTGNPRL